MFLETSGEKAGTNVVKITDRKWEERHGDSFNDFDTSYERF